MPRQPNEWTWSDDRQKSQSGLTRGQDGEHMMVWVLDVRSEYRPGRLTVPLGAMVFTGYDDGRLTLRIDVNESKA